MAIGPGPVGARAAMLLASLGSHVTLATIPAEILGERYNPNLAQQSLESARQIAHRFSARREWLSSRGKRHASAATPPPTLVICQVINVPTLKDLMHNLDAAEIVITAGPAGLQPIPPSLWSSLPGLRYLLDFNLAEPPESKASVLRTTFKEREGKQVLGPLVIGKPKMKVHKACAARLFEQNDLVLDTFGVYQVAAELIQKQNSQPTSASQHSRVNEGGLGI